MNIHTYLSKLTEETVRASLEKKALNEKEKQVAATPSVAASDHADKGNSVPQKHSKTFDDQTEKLLEKGDIETDDIVEKLNAIRSGHSLKDDNIAKAMDNYVKSLSKAERTALYAFLTALNQIMVATLPSTMVLDPSENPANVEMKKNPSQNTSTSSSQRQYKVIKPNVIKTQIAQKSPITPSTTSKENTTAPKPKPITPKRRD